MRRRALYLLLLIGLFFWTLPRFAPYALPTTFNSDSAIPVMMANEPTLTPYDLFFYGMDRYGAWGMFLPHLWHQITGHLWSADALFVLRQVFVFAALIFVFALAGGITATAMAAFLCCQTLIWNYTSGLEFVYGWVFTPFLAAWWALRRGHLRAAAVFALFTTWASTLATPGLFVIAAVEGFSKRRLRWQLFVPIVSGTLGELVLRVVYHRYSRARFGTGNTTILRGDLSNFFTNLSGVWQHMQPFHAGVPAAIAVACGLCFAWRAWRRGDFEDDHQRLVVGAAATAVLAVAGLSATNWVRINDYDPRYVCFSVFFACLVSAALLAKWLQRWPLSEWLAVAVAFACCWAVGRTPVVQLDNSKLFALGDVIAVDYPGAAILGDYWTTYLFAGQHPEAHFHPVPQSGMRRVPIEEERAKEARCFLFMANNPSAGSFATLPDTFVWHDIALQRQTVREISGEKFGVYLRAP